MTIKLVAVRKDEQGQITHFLTDRDTVISVEEAERMATEGEIDSLTELHADGTWAIDSSEQHMEGSNLADLPNF